MIIDSNKLNVPETEEYSHYDNSYNRANKI